MNLLASYIIFWLILGSMTCVCGLILFLISAYKNRLSFAILSILLLGTGLATLQFVKSFKIDKGGGGEVAATDTTSALVQLLESVGNTPLKSADVERLSRSNEIGTNEWMRLLLYRIQLRKSLAELAKKANVQEVNSGRSLTYWINLDARNLLITAEQARALCKVRDDSHYFEWQEGTKPLNASIEELSKLEPKLLDALIEDLNSTSLKVHTGVPAPPVCPPIDRPRRGSKITVDD